jgi:hypothetical protein
MRRKWHPILATTVVLAFALFEYVHNAQRSFDLAAMTFNFDDKKGKLEDIPAEIRRLDGQVISAEGFMVIADFQEPIRQFAVVPSLFGSPNHPPSVTEVVVATCPKGCRYIPDLIRVSGTLHVRITRDGEYIVSLFDVDAQQVSAVYDRDIAKWPWFVIGGIPAAGMLIILRRWMTRRRRQRLGRCVQCGYDLRSSPIRCPECGLARFNL